MPQVSETIFSKGFCENFCNLFGGINWVHDNCSITKKSRKWWYLMAICFFLGVNFGLFATVIQLSLSSQTVQRNTRYLVISPNKTTVSFIILKNGINYIIEVDRAMYSLSVVLRAIYVWILLPQLIGHPSYIIKKLCVILMSLESCDHHLSIHQKNQHQRSTLGLTKSQVYRSCPCL